MDISEFLSHRPRWLYEASPYLYCLIGLAVLAWPHGSQLHSTLITVSGMAFVVAGLHVLSMRWRYRHGQQKPRDDHEVALVAITWDRSKESDHLEFNKLNKQLFMACQHLIEDAQRLSHVDLRESIEQTIELIRFSFQRTTKILSDLDAMQGAALHQTHHALLGELDRRYREFLGGSLRRNEFIAFLVYRIVADRARIDCQLLNEALWA